MNSKPVTKSFSFLANVLILIGLLFASLSPNSGANAINHQREIILKYEVETPLSSDVSAAIIETLSYWPKEFPDNNTFYVIDVRNEKNWGIATLTTDISLHQVGDELLPDISNTFPIVFLRVKPGTVDAAASFSPNINNLLKKIPENRLSSEAKDALFDVDGALYEPNIKSSTLLI